MQNQPSSPREATTSPTADIVSSELTSFVTLSLFNIQGPSGLNRSNCLPWSGCTQTRSTVACLMGVVLNFATLTVLNSTCNAVFH